MRNNFAKGDDRVSILRDSETLTGSKDIHGSRSMSGCVDAMTVWPETKSRITT